MAEFDAHTRSRLEALRVGYARGLAARIGEVVQVWRRYSEGGDSAEDLRTLIRLAHNIVGSSATFGFSEVSVHAKALELRLNEIWRDADGDTAPYAAEIDAMLGEVQRCGDDAAGSLPEALPAMPEVERPAAISSPPTDKASAIYVVDDDQEVADDLAHQIACFGYEVETFADRTSVEKAIRRARPLAVVCDIVFPEGEPLGAHPFDGINNARAASESDRVLPVVYISSRDDFGARLWAARAGADGYFTKPVDVVGLIERLDALTERQLPEPIRVLVVDDSRSVGTHYTMVLEQAGIVSSVVSDPMQAIDALSAFKPDLILMDVYMPGCSGPELAAVIRQQSAYVGGPIVFLSSEVDRDKQLEAMRAVGDEFLTKPIEPDHLIGAVRTRAERWRIVQSFLINDGLTGVANHSTIANQLAGEVSDADERGAGLALAMIDIDHFRSVNETYGYVTGDRVIKGLSRLLLARFPRCSGIGRYGGEEFAVILPDMDGRGAMHRLNEFRGRVADVRQRGDEGGFSVTVSCGIATFPQYGDVGALTGAAERALKRAKRSGRNRVMLAGA